MMYKGIFLLAVFWSLAGYTVESSASDGGAIQPRCLRFNSDPSQELVCSVDILELTPSIVDNDDVMFSVFGVLGRSGDRILLFPDMLRAQTGGVRAAIYLPDHISDIITQDKIKLDVPAVVVGYIKYSDGSHGLGDMFFSQVSLVRVAPDEKSYPSTLVFPKK